MRRKAPRVEPRKVRVRKSPANERWRKELFKIYYEMGAGRTFHKAYNLLREKYPQEEIPLLETAKAWMKQDAWANRIEVIEYMQQNGMMIPELHVPKPILISKKEQEREEAHLKALFRIAARAKLEIIIQRTKLATELRQDFVESNSRSDLNDMKTATLAIQAACGMEGTLIDKEDEMKSQTAGNMNFVVSEFLKEITEKARTRINSSLDTKVIEGQLV